MKMIIKLTLAAALTVGTFETFAQDDPLARLRAQRAQELQQLGAQPADATPAPAPDAAPTPPQVDDAPPMDAPSVAPVQTADSTASASTAISTNGITLNFRNAPLDMVLNYLSDAAGFIIVLDTQVSGRVNVISSHPMTQDEAVDLLNTVLNQNGLAAIRDGRTLTIMTKTDAIHRDIPVLVGNDPKVIPKNDEIVTQIIPIRFVDAEQLLVDLSAFVSPQATIVANQAGNSIVITDTQSNIRHLTEIIESIDSSAEMETTIQVFPLKYANPNDVVATLAGVFPSTGTGGTTSVGGRGGRAGGGGNPFAALFGGGGGGGGGNTSQARVQKAQQVLAVADGRTQSVIVTAAKDMMPQIKEMIDQLDVKSERDTDVYTVHLDNADPYAALQVLQNTFPSSSSSASRSSTSTGTDPLTTRQTQMNSSSSSSSSGFGTTSGSTRGGGGGGLF
jgi:general secretion pathway protein D